MCLRFPRFVLKFLRREVEIGLFLFNITARNGKLQHSKSASVESVSTCQSSVHCFRHVITKIAFIWPLFACGGTVLQEGSV